MILAELRDYIRQRGQASLQDLARHFDTEPEVLRGMLAHWVRKGQVHHHIINGCCGGCTQCDPTMLEFFSWGDAAIQPNAPQPLIRDLGCHH
jgi:putative ferrous iron transport protein C